MNHQACESEWNDLKVSQWEEAYKLLNSKSNDLFIRGNEFTSACDNTHQEII
jgi:hypothetical protein